MGLQTDLKLRGDNYQWLGSMFYFVCCSELLGSIVSFAKSLFLLGLSCMGVSDKQTPATSAISEYSSFNVIMWGLTLCCMAATSNFAGAVAVRFFLGLFEAAVTPGFALFSSQWYTVAEQSWRVNFWFSFNGFAQIFGGLVAYGIPIGVERHGAAIAAWKIVFLSISLLTAAIGVTFLFMPDNQLNARFLTKEERIMAV